MNFRFLFVCILIFSQITLIAQKKENGIVSSNKYNAPETQDGSGSLGIIYNKSACGLNYFQYSKITTNRMGGGSGFPTTLTVSALPECTYLDTAFLWIGGSYKGSINNATVTITDPSNNSISYAPHISGTGGDKCWSEDGTVTYRIDVTQSFIGNGVYTIDITGVTNPNYWLDGVNLIVIYRDRQASYYATLVIEDGNITNGSGGSRSDMMTGFVACGNSSYARGFLIVSDVQANAGPTYQGTINGITSVYNKKFWNFDTVLTSVTAGQTSATFGVDAPGDCYTIYATGLYFQTNSCVTCTPVIDITGSSITNPTCNGLCDGSINLSAIGGQLPYSYTLDGTPGITSKSNVCDGKYLYAIKDSQGCIVKDTIDIIEPPILTPTIVSVDSVQCNGGSDGVITASVSGGTPTYSYSWSNSSTNQNASLLSSGNYTLTVTDINGCTANISSVVLEPDPITLSISTAPTSCIMNDGSAIANTIGGVGNYNYSWSNGETSNIISGLGVGSYTLQVIDGNLCTANGNATIIFASPFPTADFTINPTSPSIIYSTVNFINKSSGATNYLWNFGDTSNYTTNTSNDASPYYNYQNLGVYCASLIVVNEYSCKDTAELCFEVKQDFSFFISNSFSPNGDMINDDFFAFGVGISEFQLIIFDRWGIQTYNSGKVESPEKAIPWNGKYQNMGNKLAQQDVYVWKAYITDVFGKLHSFVGHVNLIR
ncbi:MAG: gliding motility-associated C-terminal domain-containing protein [Bacteroidetes bacterium]|nr:gliding motility-associated C-terminal domain-containing protein [Bacteroidota bacterium]